MENIYIEATSDKPAVKFETSGRLMIEGRSLARKFSAFYDPLIEWVRLLNTEIVTMDINLEYVSSTSSRKLLEILKILDANNKIRELTINWYYEADDEEALERGQVFEELLRKASFRYYELSEAA